MRSETQEILFPTLTDLQIACLRPYGREADLEAGARLFTEGEAEHEFSVVLAGRLHITRQVAGEAVTLRIHGPGEFTGALTLVTGEPNIATGTALEPCRLLSIPQARFREALGACPDVATLILFAMAGRKPEADAIVRQREKLAALGKLAAGLAHELNNPAAAAGRAAGQLFGLLDEWEALTLGLGGQTSPEQADCLRSLARETPPAENDDPLARSDREGEIGDWLEARGLANAWDLAPALADSGLDAERLEAVAAGTPPDALGPALSWLAAARTARDLLRQIEGSSGRIAELVRAIKEYSYMDQAASLEIDLHDGLENTLTILRSRLKHGVTIVRDYDRDLPRITAYGGELNQVWTNLIDNAVDAMDGRGTLTLRTRRAGDRVSVEIADDGPGIPPEIQPRIFEPFFTTKPQGQGTGLGLDISYRIIVNRHHGEICVDSRPGETVFRICLPIHPPKGAAHDDTLPASP